MVARIEEMAHRDYLTGLYNRKYFFEKIRPAYKTLVEEGVEASEKALALSPGNPMALDNLRRAEVMNSPGAATSRLNKAETPLSWFLAVAGAVGAIFLIVTTKNE